MTRGAGPQTADVLVLGASFVGVELLRRLRRSRRGRALSVVVVDRQATHPYIPLGHELLTRRLPAGVLGETELETSRYATASPGVTWIEAEVASFDPKTKTARLADGRELGARFVVVGLGSEVAPPASLPGGDAMVAYKFKAQLERARVALEAALEGEAATIIVVGGGITGVEIAGELAHLRASRPDAFRRAPAVALIHGGERLLPGLTPRAGHAAAEGLRAQGVELHLGTRLLALEPGRARLRGPSGELALDCALGVWAGGVQPPAVLASLGLPRTEDGWLRVEPTLQCVGYPGIFAGGDVARVEDGGERWPTMQRAIEAIFAAKTLARNLARASTGAQLARHRLWTDFPHGVSMGGRALIVYGPLVSRHAGFNIWFRRFLMRRYMARYGV